MLALPPTAFLNGSGKLTGQNELPKRYVKSKGATNETVMTILKVVTVYFDRNFVERNHF